MHIALMADVEHDLIARRVIYAVQGKRQLHHAQIRRQMPAVPGRRLVDDAAQLPGQCFELRVGKPAQVIRPLDCFQYTRTDLPFLVGYTNPCLKHEHMSEDFRAVARSGREA